MEKGNYNGKCNSKECKSNKRALWLNNHNNNYYCITCVTIFNDYISNIKGAKKLLKEHTVFNEGQKK